MTIMYNRSVACGFAPNKTAIIFFVAMTGVGAAANTPTGVGILTNHFEEGSARNRAIAVLGAGQGVGYVTGLVIGIVTIYAKFASC
jgi:MFS family permease